MRGCYDVVCVTLFRVLPAPIQYGPRICVQYRHAARSATPLLCILARDGRADAAAVFVLLLLPSSSFVFHLPPIVPQAYTHHTIGTTPNSFTNKSSSTHRFDTNYSRVSMIAHYTHVSCSPPSALLGPVRHRGVLPLITLVLIKFDHLRAETKRGPQPALPALPPPARLASLASLALRAAPRRNPGEARPTCGPAADTADAAPASPVHDAAHNGSQRPAAPPAVGGHRGTAFLHPHNGRRHRRRLHWSRGTVFQ